MPQQVSEETRDRILDLAEESVLARGFGSLSISELAQAAALSKNGFFYHFSDKTELARAMLQRYVQEGHAIFMDTVSRTSAMCDDPLDQLLLLLRLIAEHFETLQDGGHPGCLVAASCYHDRLFDAKVRAANRDAILLRRARIKDLIDKVVAMRPPAVEVDLDDLADALCAHIDGGIVFSRVLNSSKPLSDQVLVYRSHLKLLFDPALR